MHGEYVLMRDGKIIVLRGGEEMPMEEEMTMSDGTKVNPNGQIIMANGTARMMAEGETISMDGQMPDPANMSDRKFKEEMEDEELRDDIK